MRKTSNRKTSRTRKRLSTADELKLRHILVPMDFSGYARQALTCAVPLARKHRAKVSLVHVIQSPTVSAWRAIPGGGHDLAMDASRLVEVTSAHLNGLAIELVPRDVRGKTIIREGNPAAEVVAVGKEFTMDLIVLSNTGRSGVKRILLGSTAERIVRHAHCPVLTVPRRQSGPAMRLWSLEKPLYEKGLPWKRILVPLDFSPASLRALKVAVPLARQSGARLLLLHVVEPNPYPTGMEAAGFVKPDAVLAKQARRRLPQVARRFVPRSVHATALVGHGRAADVMVETAEEKGADLIVLSTHGHTGLDRLLMGSTAEHTIRGAKCPVLVVRTPRGA